MTKNRLPLFFFDAVDQPIRFSSFGFPYRVTEWKKTRYTGWVPVASKEIHIGFLSPSDWRRWLAFYRIYRKSYEDVEIHFDVHGLLRFDVVYSSFPFRKASLE